MQWNANICFLFFELLSFSPFALINRANQLPSPQNSGPWKGATCKWRRLEAWGWEAHQDRCNLPKSFQIYAQLPKTQRTERPSTGTRGPDGSPDFWSHTFASSSSSPTCRKQPGKVPCQGGAGRYWQDAPEPGADIGRMDGNLLLSWSHHDCHTAWWWCS